MVFSAALRVDYIGHFSHIIQIALNNKENKREIYWVISLLWFINTVSIIMNFRYYNILLNTISLRNPTKFKSSM